MFQHRDKKVMLTEAGRILYPEAKKMLRHYQKIKEGLEDLKGLKTGHLMVGTMHHPRPVYPSSVSWRVQEQIPRDRNHLKGRLEALR